MKSVLLYRHAIALCVIFLILFRRVFRPTFSEYCRELLSCFAMTKLAAHFSAQVRLDWVLVTTFQRLLPLHPTRKRCTTLVVRARARIEL
jgi:hypothetical protein